MWLSIQNSGAKPGDEIVVTDPMYYPFFTAVETCQMKPSYWKIHEEDGYKFDIEGLKKAVTKKTKLIFVCNPHNPSGRVMTKEELKGIADVAVDNKINIMVDELWDDIVFDGRKHVSLATLSPEVADLTVTSWGISKTWGLPGLQCGYLTATPKVMESLKKRAKGVLRGTTTLSLVAAQAALDRHSEYWVKDIMNHLTQDQGHRHEALHRDGLHRTRATGHLPHVPQVQREDDPQGTREAHDGDGEGRPRHRHRVRSRGRDAHEDDHRHKRVHPRRGPRQD